MKKGMVMLLIASMLSMTLLSGCNKDDTSESTSAATSATEDEGTEIKAKKLLKATDYNVEKYVTLMDDYMNLTVELDSDYEVTEDVVRDYIETSILPSFPVYTEGDKMTVEDGDVVNIDYEGTLDGEAFDGGTDTGYDLTIGSDEFIDGFEDGLIGANVGDSLDLELTFPEDYANSDDLAGQDVVFHVTINAIMDATTLTYDEMTDDYVNENFADYGMTTVDELYSYCFDYLTSSYESSKQSDIQTKAEEALLDGCTVEFPDGLLDERTEEAIASVKSAAEEAGLEFEDYISDYYGYDNEEDFTTYVSDSISESLKWEMILEAIVADQKTSINTADFETFVDYYVSYYSYDSNEDFYEDYGGEDYVMLQYAEYLAFESIVENVTTTVADSTDDTETDDTSATEE